MQSCGKLVNLLIWSPLFYILTGTETDFFAGYRACRCLEGQYRTNMFERCYKCGTAGLKCQDDYATLKYGHWWEWRNDTHKDRYKDFIKNLLASSPSLNSSSIQYPFVIPAPYKCKVEEACEGGLDSPCANGYEGPICSVCSTGFYKQLQTCKRCPSRKWIVGQLSVVVIVIIVIIVFLFWTRKRNASKAPENPFIDMFLSKMKIVIGFYQVTYGLLQVFSYIKWPESLESIAEYSGILQLNVLQITQVNCLFPKFHFDAFGSLVAIMAINAAFICFSGIGYGVHKLIILRSRTIDDNIKSKRVSQSKKLVVKNLFFFMYVTYLSTCSKTATVLPAACTELCRDKKESFCSKYLKGDYSVRCQGETYNHMLVMAYLSTAYILALPTASFIVLWKRKKARSATKTSDTSREFDCNSEIVCSLRFLFENYKPSSWYWELVEMTRKVILTSGIILVGQESRSYIGLALVTAGMYGVLFATVRPMQGATENRMMTISLAVTVVNLAIGAVSRIPTENIPGSTGPDIESVVFKILVFGANTAVVALLTGKALRNYFKLQ